MYWIALKMLTGDRAKYFGIIFGIAFASLLIAQQSSTFVGLMSMTTSLIHDTPDPDVWVMDPGVEYVDDVRPLSDDTVMRVRGVKGVAWAVPFYKGLGRARFEDGRFQQVLLLGIDDTSFVGAPRKLTVGSLNDLRKPDAVIMDERGYRFLWPGQPFTVGRTFEMNDHRAVLVGICKASRTFQTFPVLYTRYSQAIQFAPQERKVMSFVLVKAAAGWTPRAVAEQITKRTGLQARTREEFYWMTIDHYLKRSGIPINFGLTVLLGLIVGIAITGQTFYLFTIENLKQFGTLKAMGTSNTRIVGMILLQAAVVGAIGYGIGIGLAALFGYLTESADRLAFFMPWHILVATGIAVLLILVLSSLLSIRRVLVVDPAVVFRE